jgi:hypothetical protein
MTLQDRAVVIGHYPTAGLGGGIDRVAMPEDEEFTFTQGRSVDPNGEIHIEGIGVIPDIRVPVTEAAIFGEGDPVLIAAVTYLSGYVDGGEILLGDEITGSLAPGTKIRYLLNLSGGDVVSIILQGSKEMILGFYDEVGNLLTTREGIRASLEGFEVPFDLILILEVASGDDAGVEEYTLSAIELGE